MRGSVLIISFKLLGDVIVQTPAIKSIKERWPHSKLSVLLDERFEDVLLGNKDVDIIIPYPFLKYKKSHFIKKFFFLISFLFKLKKERFDTVLLMDKTSLGCLISFFCRAKVRAGLKNQPLSFLLNKKVELQEGSMDFIEFYNKLAQSLGDVRVTRKTQLFVHEANINKAQSILKSYFSCKQKFISIHLGASREDKMWKYSHFAMLIKDMLNKNVGLGVILMCGPQEKERIESLYSYFDAEMKSHIFDAGELYIKELVSYFSLSSLVVCHDSASRHVAMAIGRPTLVLMNSWNLENWKLYSESEGQFVMTPQTEELNAYNVQDIPYENVSLTALQILSRHQGGFL